MPIVMLLQWLSSSLSINMVGHTSFGSLAESHPIHLPSLHGKKESIMSFGPPKNTADYESVVGIKPDDFGVVIWYQSEEFTCTYLAECFVAQAHIYPGSQIRCQLSSTLHLKQSVEVVQF